jgi:hypothetical protein
MVRVRRSTAKERHVINRNQSELIARERKNQTLRGAQSAPQKKPKLTAPLPASKVFSPTQ